MKTYLDAKLKTELINFLRKTQFSVGDETKAEYLANELCKINVTKSQYSECDIVEIRCCAVDYQGDFGDKINFTADFPTRSTLKQVCDWIRRKSFEYELVNVSIGTPKPKHPPFLNAQSLRNCIERDNHNNIINEAKKRSLK